MSLEDIQRQHIEELRKENNHSRTPSPASVTSVGKTKRTARKSATSRRTSGSRSSVDTIASITKEDDNISITSDTSRTSEQDEIRKIILGLEKDADSSNSSKDVVESHSTLGSKPFLFSLGDSLFTNSGNDSATDDAKGDLLEKNENELNGFKPLNGKEASDITADSQASVTVDDKKSTDGKDKTLNDDIEHLEVDCVDEKSNSLIDESKDALTIGTLQEEEQVASLPAKDGAELVEKQDGESEVVNSPGTCENVQKENTNATEENALNPDSEISRKDDELGVQNMKLWENIQKDLTCMKDVEDLEGKQPEFDDLPLGEALPHAVEEPSDWEEWEENSEDHEQVEQIDTEEAKPVAAGECVLISSDDENSREAGNKGEEKNEADKEITEKLEEMIDASVEKEENASFTEEVDDGERLQLSDSSSSDGEFASPSLVPASSQEDNVATVEPEDGVVCDVKDSEAEDVKEEEELPKTDEEEKAEGKKEEIKEAGEEKDDVKEEQEEMEDELIIVDEKRGEKRASEEGNTSAVTDVEVKKVKLDSPEVPKEEEKEKDVEEDKPSPNILSKKILEELISRKIKDFMVEGNRNAFTALKDRCDALEKSVERWKFRAQNLQMQLNELVLEQKRYNARKTKVSTRTVGINVRMVQVQSPVSSGSGAPVKLLPAPPPPPAALNPKNKTTNKTPSTRSGPVPCHLIANMASPGKGISTATTSSKSSATTTITTSTTTATSVKFIDLTQDEENLQKSIAASLPSGTVVRPALVSTPVVSLPMVQGSSIVQMISPSGTRLPSSPTVPPGARVTYFVPNPISTPRQQLVAIPQQNISLPNPRAPMQTILLRMNTVPQSGTASPQFITSPPANTTLSLVSSSTALKPVASSKPAAITATTAAAATSAVTTVTSSPAVAAPASTLVISCLQKHPASLPVNPTYFEDPKLKSPPPIPVLKISRVTQGIVLSWNMTVHAAHAEISVYQLYAYQETSGPPSTSLWKKVGDVRALPLPMACTLTQFVQGHKYHFAVRAVDTHNRMGPFSEPASIILHTK